MIILYVLLINDMIFILPSEYYFSDENLQKDFFLRGQVRHMYDCTYVHTCMHAYIRHGVIVIVKITYFKVHVIVIVIGN